MDIDSQTLKLIKGGINDLSSRQIEELLRYCKRKIYLNNMEKRCFKKWKHGKATPIDEETLKKWEYNIKFKRIKTELSNICFEKWEHGKATPLNAKIRDEFEYRQRKKELSNISFKRWCEGKATPLNNKIRDKFESRQFKHVVLSYYGIDCDNYEFSIHHLFPKKLFPSLKYDINNVVPLTHSLHNPVHVKYSNPELAIDPITPVIEALELSIMESK